MTVYSARRMGKFEAYGRCFLPFSMFVLEEVTLKVALSVASKFC